MEREYLVDGADQLLLRLFCSPPLSSAHGTVVLQRRGRRGAGDGDAHGVRSYVEGLRRRLARADRADTLAPSPRPRVPKRGGGAPVAFDAPTPSPVMARQPHPRGGPCPIRRRDQQRRRSRARRPPSLPPSAATTAGPANSASADLTVLVAALRLC